MSTIDDGLRVGIQNEITAQVTDADTAVAMQSGDLPVLSTIAMAGLMERAAYQSVLPFLPPGCRTVGTALDIEHLSASPVGIGIRVQSELVGIDGKKLVFHVEAHDAAGLIGRGRHMRYIIQQDRFIEKANQKLI